MDERTCRQCGVTKPFTREFFSPRRWKCTACMRATANKWDQDHPEKKAISRSAYKQRVTNAGGGHTSDELLLLRLMQDRKCYYCDANFGDAAIEKDHRTPLARAGPMMLSTSFTHAVLAIETKEASWHRTFLGGDDQRGYIAAFQ